MIDLDGDGRDELVVWNDNAVCLGKRPEDRWSISSKNWQVVRALERTSPGSAPTLIMPPATAIDAATGKVRWMYKTPAAWSWYGGDWLDPGGSSQLPRLIFSRNLVSGTSAGRSCRRRQAETTFPPRVPGRCPVSPATTRAGRAPCPG